MHALTYLCSRFALAFTLSMPVGMASIQDIMDRNEDPRTTTGLLHTLNKPNKHKKEFSFRKLYSIQKKRREKQNYSIALNRIGPSMAILPYLGGACKVVHDLDGARKLSLLGPIHLHRARPTTTAGRTTVTPLQ